jgi:hypothetical protein
MKTNKRFWTGSGMSQGYRDYGVAPSATPKDLA